MYLILPRSPITTIPLPPGLHNRLTFFSRAPNIYIYLTAFCMSPSAPTCISNLIEERILHSNPASLGFCSLFLLALHGANDFLSPPQPNGFFQSCSPQSFRISSFKCASTQVFLFNESKLFNALKSSPLRSCTVLIVILNHFHNSKRAKEGISQNHIHTKVLQVCARCHNDSQNGIHSHYEWHCRIY